MASFGFLTIYELDSKDPTAAADALAAAMAAGDLTGSDAVNHDATVGQYLIPRNRLAYVS